ncbi:MAG: hypothetical protein HY924_07800 [Elusimicrobia bacterium]|nr:hypothetical protein [Elusimicrobiota bacterium]
MRKMLAVACVGAALMAQGTRVRAAETQAPAGRHPLDTRVTVRVKGVPIANFLDNISEQAKVNFIVTEGLEGKQVTAFLQNVTAREALQILLEIKGLTYQQIGRTNTYVIAPRSKEVEPVSTRIYSLDHIDLDASGGDTAIVLAVRSVLSKAGRVVADPWTNVLVVTDFPELFPQIEQVIAELDKPSRNVKKK